MVERMEKRGVPGPVFISVGTPEKLGKFLESNPAISEAQAFVDASEYDFEAYKAAGFGNIAPGTKLPEGGLPPPKLGFGQWFKYFSNVAGVSPIPKDMKFGEIPEGVLRLGGVFVIRGGRVVYQHSDALPGDHAPIDEVLRAAEA